MASWTAINVEIEDDSAIEIDDTKEIQLEEAFKLYQNALRLHSLGPLHYDEAWEAYDELFNSEIWKYPEALSDFEHDLLDTISPSAPTLDDSAIIPVLTNGTADTANSFPQLVYLACKSRAQFEVDAAVASQSHSDKPSRSEQFDRYRAACNTSLINATNALARDDTDIDLWKRAGRVAEILESVRIVRFCLESVLAGDEDGLEEIDLSGLDEAYAKGELHSVLQQLQDDLSSARISKAQPKKGLLALLQQSNDPYRKLPHRSSSLEYLDKTKRPTNLLSRGIITLSLEAASHLSIAKAFGGLLSEMADEKSLAGAQRLKFDLAVCEMELGQSPEMVTEARNSPVPLSKETPHTIISQAASPASFHSVPEVAEAQMVSPAPMDLDGQASNDSSAEQSSAAVASDLKPTVVDPTPTRKRSSTAAGNEEPESRVRSKRIKARVSLIAAPAQEEEQPTDKHTITRQQHLNIKASDETMFSTLSNILNQVGNNTIGSLSARLSDTQPEDTIEVEGIDLACADLRDALVSWTDEKQIAFNTGHDGRDHVEKTTGLALFQKHLKTDTITSDTKPTNDCILQITRFVELVNRSSMNGQDVLLEWLVTLLVSQGVSIASSYLDSPWPQDLHDKIHDILTGADEYIRLAFARCTEALDDPENLSQTCLNRDTAAEFAETIFEIHLDRYVAMISPGNKSSKGSKVQTLTMVKCWAGITSDMMANLSGDAEEKQAPSHTVLRYLMASIVYVQAVEPSSKGHALACLGDLKTIIARTTSSIISLPNNSSMPTISEAAIDQEISKVKTLDFFMSVFESDSTDPEAVILKLEPILEPSSAESGALSTNQQAQIESFRSFLSSGDASLTLFLWKKLQNAYTTITYTPKVISCMFRSLEVISQQICSLQTAFQDTNEREIALLRWLRDADELVTKVLGRINDDKSAFEAMDEDHLTTTVQAVALMMRLLFTFITIDDDLRVGDTRPQSFRIVTAAKNFEKARERLRECYVRLCVLLYWLIKEATSQMKEKFANPEIDLILYLRGVHAALGDRELCRCCNKLFVRVAKTELFSLQEYGDVSGDIAQVMYDTYQIKLVAGYGDVDHGCVPESLDRDKKTANTLVPIIMDYAKRLNVKDLLRSDLKATIDKIQPALGQPKPSTAVAYNRRSISSYLKSPINPQRLLQCLRGIGEVETKPVAKENMEIASTGWYLLLGRVTIAKYRSVKRVNPTPTDDLDNALAFLKQDLEHDATSSWKSWYYLGQVYDAKVEDNLMWNSNKLNDGRGELATLERNTINAYVMAIAVAMRSADNNLMTHKLINDMYFDLATRLYSSSRPPLNMEAFSNKKAVRHLSHYETQEMSEVPSFTPMNEQKVWTLASHLNKLSLAGESQPWYRHYMLGKCLWKIYGWQTNTDGSASMSMKPVTIDNVLNSFAEAIRLLPKKEKSSDPILEPHFKIVSIVHKLQVKNLITKRQGVELMQATSYVKGVPISTDDEGQIDWEEYVLSVLKRLQTADKSGWHHRITARAAHVSYDAEKSLAGAILAKNQFVDSIFTKNMTMQVWKPENERAGRHFVYTGRYLRFFVEVLDKLSDRSNLEQVVRKIRRKTTDFIDHTQVWEDAVTVYVDLLRRIGEIPRSHERAVFDAINFDEFTRLSEKLEAWAHDTTTTTKYLDIIKDAIEIKKLNNSLMKGPAIDDIIGDAYACMYEEFVAQLPPEEQKPEPPKQEPQQGTFINLTTEITPSVDDNRDRMKMGNFLTGESSTQERPPRPSAMSILTAVFNSFTTSLPPGTPPPDGVKAGPAKPGRAKTITRREIQRKAEGAIGKPPPIKTPTLTKRSISINVPSIKKDISGVQELDDDDRSIDVSRVNSRRGSISMRNTPDVENVDDEDGAAGDDEDEGADTDAGDDKPSRQPTPSREPIDDDNEADDEGQESQDEEMPDAVQVEDIPSSPSVIEVSMADVKTT